MKLKALLLSVFSVAACCVSQAEVVIFEKGRSDARIVVDDNAPPSVKYAARELRDYLKKSGGVELPILNAPGKRNNIFVGLSRYVRAAGFNTDQLKYDGFRIISRGNDLYLFGRDRMQREPLTGKRIPPFQKIHIYNKKYDICAFGETGTLYGVYHFLRQYAGIDWFTPGELGEVVPKLDRLTVKDVNYSKSPDYFYRTAFFALFDNDPDSARWYRRVGFGSPFPVEINHSFFTMNRFRETHPEWFAMIDGKRDFDISCEKRGNLCLSQPGLLQQFVADARVFFDANPDFTIYSVMPNDWFLRICDCPDCQKQADYGKPRNAIFSNYVWNFVNNVAKEVGKTHPGKYIACCAYETYQGIPDRVKLEPNVAVMLTKARYYQFDEGYRYRNGVLPYAWKKIAKSFYIWEYYCWDSTNSHLSGLPILFSRWTEADMRSFKGVMAGEFIDGGAGPRNAYRFFNPALNSLNYYLTARLYWDTTLKVEDLLENYYRKFFGPAAPEMKNFWTLAEAIWTDEKVVRRGPSDNINGTLYTPERLLKLKSHLENARKQVKPDSVYSSRIAEIQKLFYPYVDKINNTRSQIPSYRIKRTATPPVIDGKREMLWRKANVMDFVLQQDARQPMAPTFARALHDDRNFYIFINCFEKNMKGISALARNNDSNSTPYIWEDDSVEIFISPDAAKPERTVQLIVNCAGTWYDCCYHSKDYPHPNEIKYSSSLICKSGTDKNGWTLEIAIPKKALELDGVKPAAEWKLNIGRNRTVSNINTKDMERSAWSAPLSSTWNIPGRFGNAVLEQ